MADDINAVAEVFVYTGAGEGAVVPNDVVRVRIDPSVLVLPMDAFNNCIALKEIVLHDGLREIGLRAFSMCKALTKVQLSDGIESIGGGAFFGCNFTKFRNPPLVTTISVRMLGNCPRIFSLELPEIIIRVEQYAFGHCRSLRNISLASNTVVDVHDMYHAFVYCTDLLQIFDTVEEIVNALKIRFDKFPIHGKMYYLSYYNQTTMEELLNAITIGDNGELDPTGLQQDCLGMTPLHILACSTVHSLEPYQLIVDKYPANLIVEDAWGAVPLLYAIWGDVPTKIVQFLVNSYQSLYPDHAFDWNSMIITMGRANAPEGVIRNLLNTQPTLSPGYNIDWDQVLGVLAEETELDKPHANPKTFCFLTRCSIAMRVNAISVKHFRDTMDDSWMGGNHNFNRQEWRAETITKLQYYESEYQRLKEMTSMLELALWKVRMDDSLDDGKTMVGGNKKMKIDQPEFRKLCRISCGADHVIENAWQYLLPSDFIRSYVDVDEDEEDDDEDSIDNNDDDDDEDEDYYGNG